MVTHPRTAGLPEVILVLNNSSDKSKIKMKSKISILILKLLLTQQRRKRNIFLQALIICTAFCLCLSGCGNEEPIKIGFVGTLSGTSSEFGVYARNAVRFAVEEVNEQGGINGRKIELYIADDKGNPSDGLKAAKELYGKGVIAVIGHSLSGPQSYSIPFFKKNKILMISPTVTNNKLTGIDDNYIKLAGSNKEQAQMLADYAFQKKNYRDFGIIYDINNIGYSKGLVDGFTQRVKQLKGNILYLQQYTSGDYAKLAGFVQSIKPLRLDAVLLVAAGIDNAVFCQMLKKNSMDTPVLTGIWATTEDLITYGGNAVDRIITVNGFDWQNSSPKYLEFSRKYYRRYNVPSTFTAAFGYNAAQILFMAIEKCSSVTYEELKSNITGKSFPGLQGNINIDRYGDVENEPNILVIRNGKFVKAE